MPRYSFYQDTKVETWERSHFDVIANSYEEAVAIVKAFKDSDVDNHQDEEYIEFGTFESIYETSQKIEPLPGASPTIMIFDEDTDMPVVDNRKPAGNNSPNDKEHAIPDSCDFETDIRERQTVGGDQPIGDAVAFALRCVADGLAVQVAVVALGHTELIQHIHQLLRLCAGV